MALTFRTLSCFVAGAAILLGASASIAVNRPPRSTQSIGRTELEVQILLDRADFSSGEIDGEGGKNSREALAAFQAARGLRSRQAALKALGAGVIHPIVPYTITAEDVAGPFAGTIPEDATAQSKLPGLYYTSVLEELCAKFHSAPALLKRLNPRARFVAGEHIRVPNVLDAQRAAPHNADATGEEGKRLPAHGEAVKVVVSKKASVLKVYDREGQIIFYAPVTSGSDHDPLPFGNWVVTSVVRNPTYNYNPDLFWDADATDAKVKIAAGPNNPVGVVWIGINVPHYGIHGTPDPREIGHSQSHGCVRMTNWDASSVAGLVKDGTSVVFED
jgi:lipoprotein-anchoring transpeptidase ErfK/SrfK